MKERISNWSFSNWEQKELDKDHRFGLKSRRMNFLLKLVPDREGRILTVWRSLLLACEIKGKSALHCEGFAKSTVFITCCTPFLKQEKEMWECHSHTSCTFCSISFVALNTGSRWAFRDDNSLLLGFQDYSLCGLPTKGLHVFQKPCHTWGHNFHLSQSLKCSLVFMATETTLPNCNFLNSPDTFPFSQYIKLLKLVTSSANQISLPREEHISQTLWTS